MSHGIDEVSSIQNTGYDTLDDVFDSTDDVHPSREVRTITQDHPSDIARLRSEHTTAGYREGVATAKANSVQAGFDEGFSLGATIGLEAGQILGFLEGITEGLANALDLHKVHLAAQELLKQARDDLSPPKIFSPEYWADDANWKFDVRAQDEKEVVFSDVAKAHPLIRKWLDIIDFQMEEWKIDPLILDNADIVRVDHETSEAAPTTTQPAAQKVLDW